MYPRNAASPERIAIGAVVQISDGAVQTSGVSIKVKPQGTTASAGGGTTSYEEGIVEYLPTQAETNYTSFTVIAYKTGCIPVATTVVTSASATAGTALLAPTTHTSAVIPTVSTLTGHTPQTGDAYARLGAPAGASVSADVAAVKAQTAAIETDTAEIGAAGAGLTALASAANLATLAGYVDTEVTAIKAVTDKMDTTLEAAGGSPNDYRFSADALTHVPTVDEIGDEVQGRTIAAVTTVGTVNALAANSVTAAALAADAVTEIQSGLATAAAVDAIDDFVDTEVGAIKEVTDRLSTMLADEAGSPGEWRFTPDAVAAVWDATLAEHLAAGTTGNALNAAGAAGDPWSTSLPGAYGAGSAGYIVGNALDATVSSRASQASVDAIDTVVDAILVDTAEIGAAGAGLSAIPWNAAWDAEVQSEVADALVAYDPPTHAELLARTLASADYATAAALDAVDDFVDTEVAAIKSVTDKLDGMLVAGSPADWRFTFEALEGVWDVPLAEHLDSGSTGFALNAAGSAGDPWGTALPGAYGPGTAGNILGNNLDAAVSTRASQASVDTVDGIVDAILVDTGTDIPSTLATIAGYVDTEVAAVLAAVDTEVAAIMVVTDKLHSTLEAGAGSPNEFRFSADALVNAPAGEGGSGAAPTAGEIADAVWAAALPGAYSAGQAGKVVGDNLNATVGSRATQTSVDTVDGIVDDILVDTGTTLPATLETIAGYIDTEVASILAAVDTEVAAIKAKTDNLPAEPAATGDIPSAASIADAVWDEAVSGHVSGGSFGKALDDTDKRGSRTVPRGTVDSGSTLTSIVTSALSPAGAAIDQFKGRVVIFDNDTATAELRGQGTIIEANTDDAAPTLTVTALTTAPSAGDTFSIA